MIYRITILLLALSLTELVQAQSVSFEIKEEYQEAPGSVASSPPRLAEYLTHEDSSEVQKAANIYTWIINNIAYDVNSVQYAKEYSYSAKQVLQRKKAVGHQFAHLFHTLSLHAGLTTVVIEGYRKSPRALEGMPDAETTHYWNALRLDSAWYLVDVTMGSGVLVREDQDKVAQLLKSVGKYKRNERYVFERRLNYNYFLADPRYFIKKMLPADPAWQLLRYPVSLSTFRHTEFQRYTNAPDTARPIVVDSIENQALLNSYERLSANKYLVKTATIAHRFNPDNHLILGEATLFTATAVGNSVAPIETQVKRTQQIIKNNRRGIRHLEQHQKTVNRQVAVAIRTSNSTIKTRFLRPLQMQEKRLLKRILKSETHIERGEALLAKTQQSIVKLNQHIKSKKYPTLDMRVTPGTANQVLVQQYREQLEQEQAMLQLNQDSTQKLLNRVSDALQEKTRLQEQLLELNQHVSMRLWQVSYTIAAGESLSAARFKMDSAASQMRLCDSLFQEYYLQDRAVLNNLRTAGTLQTTLTGHVAMIQKLLYQSYQQSAGQVADTILFDEGNAQLKAMLEEKLSYQHELLLMRQRDLEFHTAFLLVADRQQEEVQRSLGFAHFLMEHRAQAFTDYQNRSNAYSGHLIADAQKDIEQLERMVLALRKEMRGDK